MHEEEVIDQLKAAGISLVASLPCDKNKGFNDLLHERMRTVDLAKEEDGVGICAGAYLAGVRAAMSIQSSGLGNMMNALMSLDRCYRIPLAIIASWRGLNDEKIEAQRYFNQDIPNMLDVYGIGHTVISKPSDINILADLLKDVYAEERIHVLLIPPDFWGTSERVAEQYPPRSRTIEYHINKSVPEPVMTRKEAISEVMSNLDDETVVVSNIGVPSKELYSLADRPLNFYMLGSFGQATPIGLGIALSTDRKVVVLDGEGSLLTNNILPVLAAEKPDNLTVVCLDNGTYGSTGNQLNHGYCTADIGVLASAFGIPLVSFTNDPNGIRDAIKEGYNFLQIYIKPGNSDSPNIDMSAISIRERFMAAMKGVR